MAPTPQYLARYNGYRLPGYVQQESTGSQANIADHGALYSDGARSEYTGLANKNIALRMKLWECDYATAKSEAQRAATILRSNRDSFAPLYIQWPDRYYEALTQNVSTQKEVPTSIRLREYTVNFEARPWLMAASGITLTGTGTVSTSARTITEGGWTPTIITVTGTNVTISGYTAAGEFAGFVSVSGAVTNMIIDSDRMEATIGGINANDRMMWADYQTFVGPGNTSFTITGAASCSIFYRNRWYI